MRLHFACVFILGFGAQVSLAQDEPKLLQASGFGSLSGKIVDAKSKKPIADAVVFLSPPKGTYFPVQEADKKRPDLVVQMPPGQAFGFKVLTHYPYYREGTKEIPTGQRLLLKGDANQDHGLTLFGKKRMDQLLARANTETVVTLQPQLLPWQMQSNVYAKMIANIYVFDHPYHAITDQNGDYKIPRVPAGVELSIMAWNQEDGWLLTNKGVSTKFSAEKNTFDLEAKK